MRITLEELGKGMNACVRVDIDYDVTPGEDQSWDHPGCPPSVDLTDVRVVDFVTDTHDVTRDDRPDWFAWLDGVIWDILESEWDKHEEDILEDAADQDEAAYEEYCDSLREIQRCG